MIELIFQKYQFKFGNNMKVFTILLIYGGPQVQGLFLFNKVRVLDNLDYLKSYLTIDNSSGVSVLSGNFTLLKELNLRITV
jgi:hypothetical protein